MKKLYIKIEGIHCEHCNSTIRKILIDCNNVISVEIRNHIAEITYENTIDPDEIIRSITDAGYYTKKEYISDKRKDITDQMRPAQFLVILAGILIAAFILQKAFGFDVFNMIPSIDSNITYGMLVLTGMLTSIHCISMCGAINLTAAAGQGSHRSFQKPFLYNLGRVISYTGIGAIIGMVGSVFEMNSYVSGIVILIAAIVMLLMSLGMMGIFDFHMPKWNFLSKLKFKVGSNAFGIGLLNGLMPCGPLQAMQLYALSTGSVIMGALSMSLFGIGTVPLMLFVGLLVNLLSGKRRMYMNKIASVLILVLSVVMLNRGLLTLGIDLFTPKSDDYSQYVAARIVGETQEVKIDLEYSGYEDIVVQKGIPVRFIIRAGQNNLTGCNNEVQCNELNFSKKLERGENIIEFTPTEEGSNKNEIEKNLVNRCSNACYRNNRLWNCDN